MKNIHIYSHILFSLIILPNLTHFGNNNAIVAVIINGTPWTLAQLIYLFRSNQKKLYFVVITTPIWFETGLYMFNKVF